MQTQFVLLFYSITSIIQISIIIVGFSLGTISMLQKENTDTFLSEILHFQAYCENILPSIKDNSNNPIHTYCIHCYIIIVTILENEVLFDMQDNNTDYTIM